MSNDFIQYYLGAWIARHRGDRRRRRDAAVQGLRRAVRLRRRSRSTAATRPTTRCSGADVRDDRRASCRRRVPAVRSSRAIGFDRPPSYDPPEGTKYAYAKSSDEGYQRLRAHDRPDRQRPPAALKFKISYDTELDYDYVFVEAHTVGQDDWTTLPDKNGHTDTNVGRPVVRHRLGHRPPVRSTTTRPTRPRPTDCTNTGTTGAWNAATGNSGGFQDWEIDLSAYKGKQVEVSITYAQDFAVDGLGVFLDALQVVKDGAVTESQGFETGLAPWVAGPQPAGHRERGGVDRERRRRLRRRSGHRHRGHAAVGLRPRGRDHAGGACRGPEGRGHVPHALAAQPAAGRRSPAGHVRHQRPRWGRRHRAGDAVADARPGRVVRPVHPGARRRRTSPARRRTSSPPRVTRC